MKHYCIFLLLIFFAVHSYGQNKTVDIELIKQRDSHTNPHNDAQHNHNNTDVLKYKKKSFIIKYNPISLVFTGAMFVYQNVVSPQISANCLYEISCSNFGKLAIYEFGLIKGIFITTDRLTRCNTMVIDEIPEYKYNTISGHVDDKPKYYKVRNAK